MYDFIIEETLRSRGIKFRCYHGNWSIVRNGVIWAASGRRAAWNLALKLCSLA